MPTVSTRRRVAPEPKTENTRGRIIEAARKELVSHGAAGARVDRIAKLARTSKERLYFYFASKAELIEAVSLELARRFQSYVVGDGSQFEDLTHRIFDYYVKFPEDARLWLWIYLENGNVGELPLDDFRIQVLEERINSVRKAQEEGIVSPDWNPILLINVVSALGMSRVIAPGYIYQVAERDYGIDKADFRELQREAVQDVARRIFAKAPPRTATRSTDDDSQ